MFGHKKARVRERESTGQIPPSLPHLRNVWEKCHARCLLSAPPHATYTDSDRGARGLFANQHGSTNR
jgi:hypothetical protein